MIAASITPPLVSGVLFQPFHQLFAMCLSLLLFKLPARTSSDVKRSYAKVHYDERSDTDVHGRGEGCRRSGFSLCFLFFFSERITAAAMCTVVINVLELGAF
jgi:hypothetical protein